MSDKERKSEQFLSRTKRLMKSRTEYREVVNLNSPDLLMCLGVLPSIRFAPIIQMLKKTKLSSKQMVFQDRICIGPPKPTE